MDVEVPEGEEEEHVEDKEEQEELKDKEEEEEDKDDIPSIKTKKSKARVSPAGVDPTSNTLRTINKTLRSALVNRVFDNVLANADVRVPSGFVMKKVKHEAYFRKQVTKFSNTRLPWDEVEPHLFPSKSIKISAYVNDIPGLYTCEEICTGFERCGYVSFSIIDNIGGEPTEEESDLIDR
jgi:hypothetical protein